MGCHGYQATGGRKLTKNDQNSRGISYLGEDIPLYFVDYTCDSCF